MSTCVLEPFVGHLILPLAHDIKSAWTLSSEGTPAFAGPTLPFHCSVFSQLALKTLYVLNFTVQPSKLLQSMNTLRLIQ